MKKSFLVFFILLFVSVACQDDRNNIENGTATGEQEVEFAINSPITYSSVAEDKAIVELDIVVCDKDGKFQYTRQAYYSDVHRTFRSILKVEDNINVYFFANCRSCIDTVNILTKGRAWEDIQKELIINNTSTVLDGKTVLPMWGQAKGISISETKVNRISNVSLLRAVASANVYFDLTPGVGLPFVPEVAYVYFGADKAFIAPEESNLTFKDGTISGVKRPVSPSGIITNKKDEAAAVGSKFENSLYMFDNDGTGSRSTRLVVGGYLDGATDKLTYYPLDFRDAKADTIIPATRNHQYRITIKSVNGEGWPDPDGAAEQASVNIDYKTVVWDKNDDEILYIDGLNYLSIKKYIDISRGKGVRSVLSFSTSYSLDDIELKFVSDRYGVVDAPFTDEFGNGIQSSSFQVSLEYDNDSEDAKFHFYTKEYFDDNPSQDLVEVVKDIFSKKQDLWIKIGRIEFTIQVTQSPREPGDWDIGGDDKVTAG